MKFKFKGSNYESWCHTGYHDEIVINDADYFTADQYKQVLHRLLHQVKTKELEYENSDYTGDKYNHCNWGLCTDSKAIYPTNDLHTFPLDFDIDGRQSPLSSPTNVQCPMRKMKYNNDGELVNDSDNMSGCFYQCRVFNHRIETPTRDQAITLIETEIDNLDTTKENS